MKKIYLIVLIAFTFSSCEKDDICDAATSTTPRLIIEFYDVSNPTTLKTVTNLGIIAPGFTTGIGFTGVSKIQVPLKTTEDVTSFSFIQNGSDTVTTNDNIDDIQINYTRNNVFVSRACGYKTVFTLNNTNGIVKSDAATPDGLWIQNITIATSNIANENETHVKIYF
jgi:Family of unknown function (DUF6452)